MHRILIIFAFYRAVPLFENKELEEEATEIAVLDDLCETDMINYENASTASLCSLVVNDLEAINLNIQVFWFRIYF